MPIALMAAPSGSRFVAVGGRTAANGDARFSLFGRRRGGAAAHGAGARGDRLDDVVVAGAAADIAFELFADGVLVELVALAAHDVDRGHDHSGRAVAALQAVILAERFLHRM